MRAFALLSLFLTTLTSPHIAAQSSNDPQVVRSEATIVAGNAVTAKKRALSDAFRQAVERAFADMLAQGGEVSESPRMQQLKAAMSIAGQKYVRKYRILEQEEAAGQLKLMVEIEVDSVLLRQDVEKANAEATTARPSPDTPPSTKMLIAGAMPTELSAALAREFQRLGIKSQLVAASEVPAVMAAAAQANATALLAKAQSANEGTVRGTFRSSASCVVVYQWLSPLSSKPLFEGREQDRATGTDEPSARGTCLGRLATQIAQSIGTAARAPRTRSPYFSLYVDAVEPGVLPVILAALKRLGGVSASEVRVVTPAQSEIRVFSRLAPAVLQPMLAREVAGKLTITPGNVGPDRLAFSARIPQQTDFAVPQGDR